MANQNILSIIIKAFGAQETAAEIKKPGDACKQLGETIQGVQRNIATFIGAVYSMRKAWESAEMAAQFQEQKTALNALAAQYNTSAGEIISGVKDASRGLISLADAASVSAKAIMMGLNPEQVKRFMQVVEATTNVTGQRVGQAFEMITEAAARGSERSLRQMGILVDLQAAYRRYAESIGVAVNEMTDAERQQIAINAILEQSANIMSLLGDSTDSVADKMERFKVMVQDIKMTVGDLIIRTGAGLMGVFHAIDMGLVEMAAAAIKPFSIIEKGLNMIGVKSRYFQELSETFKYAGDDLHKGMMDSFSVMTNGFQDAENKQKGAMNAMNTALSDHTERNVSDRRKWMEWEWKYAEAVDKAGQEILDNLAERDKAMLEHARTLQAVRESEIQLQLKELDLAEQDFRISKSDAVQKRVHYYEELRDVQEAYLAGLDKERDPASWYAQMNAINETRDALIKLNFELEKQTGTFTEGARYGFQQYMHDAKTAFEYGADMAQATASAMEGFFASVSFDGMKGKLKSLGDYFEDFLTSMQRSVSQILGQLAVQGAIGGLGGFFGSGASTSPFASVTTPLFKHSGGYIPRFHAGGLASDEIPAILQRGEYVVSRKGVETLDRINQGGNPGSPVVVQQALHFNMHADAVSNENMLKRNAPVIQKIIGDSVDRSRAYAAQMRGNR